MEASHCPEDDFGVVGRGSVGGGVGGGVGDHIAVRARVGVVDGAGGGGGDGGVGGFAEDDRIDRRRLLPVSLQLLERRLIRGRAAKGRRLGGRLGRTFGEAAVGDEEGNL